MLARLITIAIPTYNRPDYLVLCLSSILDQITKDQIELLEITIFDNSDNDYSLLAIQEILNKNNWIRYCRNKENIGSDANIAQCFNKANGRYVLILGDDDILVKDGLKWLIEKLSLNDYGLVCMRSYGYDKDPYEEYPRMAGKDAVIYDASQSLANIGPAITLISSCVVNKTLLRGLDANNFIGCSLVQVYLNLSALVASPANLISKRYLVACKRNNSGGYDYVEIFVEHLGKILDFYTKKGVNHKKFDRRMYLAHLPFYIFKQRCIRLEQSENLKRLNKRYGSYALYRFWLKPIASLPRPLALLWGLVTIFLGRIFYGDFIRGIYFLKNKIKVFGHW